MFLRLHFPPPPLGRFVESITYYRGLVSDHAREKLLPDGIEDLWNPEYAELISLA